MPIWLGSSQPNTIHRVSFSFRKFPEERITGTAFFPGGSGLYLKDRTPSTVVFPFGGVMILGHNFDTECGFKKSRMAGEEKFKTGTWQGILRHLGDDGAAIPLDRCFFTAAFMGLCSGDDNKEYRGRKDPRFRAACLAFLIRQIEVQKPRLILTLGTYVPPLLACAAIDSKAWALRTCSDPEINICAMDENPIFPAVYFQLDSGSHRAAVVPLVHPSYQKQNVPKRSPKGFSPAGFGEIELIRAGWLIAGTL